MHACGVDDTAPPSHRNRLSAPTARIMTCIFAFSIAIPTLFLLRVTLTEHWWITSHEHRSSELGSRITRDGVPLAAAMVLGAGPFQMAILNAANGVAVLLLGLYAGVWVDRLRRRPIMIWADAGRALLLGAIPLAAFTHRLSMPLLYIVAASAGVLTVFFDVAYQTYLPALVERENVLEGNSKLAMSASIAEVLGPALTGVLVKTLTAPVAILLDAIFRFFGRFGRGHKKTRTEARDAPGGIAWERSAGRAAVHLAEPVLRSLAAYSASMFFCFGIISPLYVLFAIRNLKMGPVLLELSIACGGVASSSDRLCRDACHGAGVSDRR